MTHRPLRDRIFSDGAAVLFLIVAGIARMAMHPGRTARMLRGGYFEDVPEPEHGAQREARRR
jgi:hypothetical protein